MSYDINFWKPIASAPGDPQPLYEHLSRGERVDGLANLPVGEIVARLKEAFPAYDPTEQFPQVDLPEGSMEIFHTDQFFRFDFRGPETGDEKARVWQILSGFGCVCYDPQQEKLFTRDDPPGYRRLTPDEVRKVEAIFGGRDINSMVRHLQTVQARRARCGCIVLLVAGLLVASAIAAGLVYALRQSSTSDRGFRVEVGEHQGRPTSRSALTRCARIPGRRSRSTYSRQAAGTSWRPDAGALAEDYFFGEWRVGYRRFRPIDPKTIQDQGDRYLVMPMPRGE